MVAIACTSFVLLIIAVFMGCSLKSKLGYGIFQSVILGLLMSVPILYMFAMSFLNIIGRLLFRLAVILGGEDLDVLHKKMMISVLMETEGVSEVQISTNDVPSETEETDTENEGDR